MQPAIDLLLHLKQQPPQRFLIGHRISAPGIGRHVIYVLDKDQIGVDLVQIFQKRPVARGPKQERTVRIPERGVVRIHGDRIGRSLLHRQGDVVRHAESGTVSRNRLLEQAAKPLDMLRRHGEVNRHAPSAHGILRPFDEVLFQRGTHLLRITMEGNQRLGHVPVVEAAGADDAAENLRRRRIRGNRPPQRDAERKALQRLQHSGDRFVPRSRVEKLEEVAEHPRRRTGSRHELHHATPVACGLVPPAQGGQPFGIKTKDAVAHGGGTYHVEVGEPAPENGELFPHRFLPKPVRPYTVRIALIQHTLCLFETNDFQS